MAISFLSLQLATNDHFIFHFLYCHSRPVLWMCLNYVVHHGMNRFLFSLKMAYRWPFLVVKLHLELSFLLNPKQVLGM